ncbi:MAG TPA: PIN domain-containing protein [Candidatus Thermoplasmatota archaeon]|jgi:predicted nucleic acid-binding protein|nr:PIN domain-containing protein [Candidatus Thermoplasmatota archaeon]
MRVADTSALFAFFEPRDEFHARARAAFEGADPIVVPAEVFTEVLFLARKRAGSASARNVGSFLWSQPNTEIQPSDTAVLMAAWGAFEASPKLSWTDCIVVATCRELDAEPLSFDKDLLRAARA